MLTHSRRKLPAIPVSRVAMDRDSSLRTGYEQLALGQILSKSHFLRYRLSAVDADNE